MAKLTGTNPDQVPTNADLGTVAYQDASRPNFDKLLVTGDTAIGADNSTNGNGAASRLDVRDTTDTYITVGNNTDNTSGLEAGIRFRPLNNLGNPAEIRAVSNFEPSTSSAYTAGLKFFTSNYNGSSFTSVEALGIAADGELRPHNNIKMNSGYGIDFSATSNSSGTMTSELLDDYEEGTWTPVLERGGTVGATYSTQFGRYVKVGAMVHVYCEIVTTAITSQSSGYSIVSGLPYAYGGGAYSTIGGVTSNMFNTTAVSKAFPSSNLVYFGVDESTSFPPKQLVWTSGNLRFSIVYWTAA